MKYKRELSLIIGESKFVLHNQSKRLNPDEYAENWSNKINRINMENHKEHKHSDAEFIGWQKLPSGEALALYNVTALKHPLYQSTVTAKTLIAQNLKMPLTPDQKSKMF
jgi:hypothetical protein